MPEDLSLGDVVSQLALAMKENGLKLLYRNEEPWHWVFYRLREEAKESGRPGFLDDLFFDAYNRYPRCRELSEYLHGLHTTFAVRVPNPSYDEIIIPEDVGSSWLRARKGLSEDTRKFLDHGLEIARSEFPARAA